MTSAEENDLARDTRLLVVVPREPIDWQALLTHLKEAGHTQTVIAEACGTTQGNISYLKLKAGALPTWNLGLRLVMFHMEHLPQFEVPLLLATGDAA